MSKIQQYGVCKFCINYHASLGRCAMYERYMDENTCACRDWDLDETFVVKNIPKNKQERERKEWIN